MSVLRDRDVDHFVEERRSKYAIPSPARQIEVDRARALLVLRLQVRVVLLRDLDRDRREPSCEILAIVVLVQSHQGCRGVRMWLSIEGPHLSLLGLWPTDPSGHLSLGLRDANRPGAVSSVVLAVLAPKSVEIGHRERPPPAPGPLHHMPDEGGHCPSEPLLGLLPAQLLPLDVFQVPSPSAALRSPAHRPSIRARATS